MNKCTNVHCDPLRQPQTHTPRVARAYRHPTGLLKRLPRQLHKKLRAHCVPSIPTPLKINPRKRACHPSHTPANTCIYKAQE